MNKNVTRYPSLLVFQEPGTHLMIQTPLPHFLDTLPILITVPGQGTGRERPSPLAPPGEPANDK